MKRLNKAKELQHFVLFDKTAEAVFLVMCDPSMNKL